MPSNLRFSLRSPCDYMMFDGRILYCLELKSFESECSFERCREDKGIIHYHQIESLKKMSTYQNIISGFILDFRKSDSTYFVSIEDFCTMTNMITKKSFNEVDMLKWCQPIKIQKKKLRINYRYDIENFIQDIQKQCIQKK